MLRLLLSYVVVLIILVGSIHGQNSSTTTVPTTLPTTDVCPGQPPCPPQPSIDCVTSYHYETENGFQCLHSCKHWCCSTVEALRHTCPETSPDDPYCVGTNIVQYTIRGRECPVYCGCVPDCLRLTC